MIGMGVERGHVSAIVYNAAMRCLTLACLVGSLAAGCGGDDPADVAGNYSVAVTNRENSCNFQGWQQGSQAEMIPMAITQRGSSVSANVGGWAGGWLELVLGGRVFTGSISGDHLVLAIEGEPMFQSGSCDFTIDATLDAEADGDVLRGELRYRPRTDGANDCGVLETCVNVQAFNGTRPPT
jgi:hypothetical protein